MHVRTQPWPSQACRSEGKARFLAARAGARCGHERSGGGPKACGHRSAATQGAHSGNHASTGSIPDSPTESGRGCETAGPVPRRAPRYAATSCRTPSVLLPFDSRILSGYNVDCSCQFSQLSPDLVMNLFTSKVEYALRAVVDLASRPGNGAIQSRELAARQGIPETYLDQLRSGLRRAGLVRSIRAAAGRHRPRPAGALDPVGA